MIDSRLSGIVRRVLGPARVAGPHVASAGSWTAEHRVRSRCQLPEQDGVVRFRILGPLELWTGQAWSAISARKQRSLLAALLADAGQIVPTDRLILEIWGDTPPAGANNLVSIYVHKLRKMIGDEGGLVLRTRAPGYQLSLEPADLDLTQFEELAGEARQALASGEHEKAAQMLAAALGLWRGHPYVDVPSSELIAAEAERLEELRLDALELRMAADLGCGRHAQVTPELSRLVAGHPLREGLWVLYLRALDGAGRHAEALAAYGKAREVIADELGVDPGEQLRRIYAGLLAADAQPPGPGAHADAGPAGPRPAEQAPPSAEPPAQLPADITDFTGRLRDVQRLCDLPVPSADDDSGAVTVALVAGTGGLGKTTLAVHAAHRLRPRFPDGQLYVNLLGVSPQPLAPGDVLARFLRDLGVDAARIPAEEEERAALLRTRLTGRRVLMLLDNARDAAQVRPLLPGSASCMVIVTTRSRLPDLAITRLIDLDVLDEEDARALFTRIVGPERAERDPDGTEEVLAACAGLPLAIRIAGARLAARSGWSVRTLAGRLRGEQRRLDELKVGDLAIRACFEVSFASLPGPAGLDDIDPARAFRLLGLWQGPAIGLPAVAALFAQPEDRAEEAVEALVDAHLLESPAPDYYRFHDLLRVYAAERCQADEPEQARNDAMRRILSWYLHTAEAAAAVISPYHARVPVGESQIDPLSFASLEDALDWSDAERANLVAANRQAADYGLHDIAWQLAAASMSFFYRRSQWADWIETHETGLESARKLGDRRGEAWMLNNLGMAYGERSMAEAADCLEQALAIYREIADEQGERRTATNLANAYHRLQRFSEAVDASQVALAMHQQAENRYVEGIVLGIQGAALRGLGRHVDSIDRFEQALAIFRELGDKDAEADALSELGESYLGLSRVDDALERLGESLDILREAGDRQGQARTLRLIGQALGQAGQRDQARESLAEAAQIFEELADHAQAAHVHRELAEISSSAS
jgi:DNA-binding SARP family transcriptional activator